MKLCAGLERNFLHPESPVEQRIHEAIESYRKALATRWETEIFAQRRRLVDAEESLQSKETKRAREDVRIATKKIQTLLDRLADLRRTEPGEDDGRIFPMTYAPSSSSIADALSSRQCATLAVSRGSPPTTTNDSPAPTTPAEIISPDSGTRSTVAIMQ